MVPGFGDDKKEKTKKTIASIAKGALSTQGHPLMDMGYYKPKTNADGYKYYALTNVYGPGILGQMPIGSLFSSMYFSRSGNWMSDIDRGDLGKWILGSQNVSTILKAIGGKTTEDILREAKDKNVDPRDYFAKHVHGLQPGITIDEGGALFDLYVRPTGVPPEYYWGRVMGLKYIPVYSYEQSARNQWNNLRWQAMSEF